MKLTVIARGQFSDEWPKLEVWVNDLCAGWQTVESLCQLDFDISLDCSLNQIRLDYTNKIQAHTKFNGDIVTADQLIEVMSIRFDDILCESWLLTDGYYCPKYFPGFSLKNPHAPPTLPSQLIWHFPGSFFLPPIPAEEKFWQWYRDQRFNHMQQYKGKDWHREQKYIGSQDMHQDLLDQIKSIINV